MFISEEQKNKILDNSANKLIDIIAEFSNVQKKGSSYTTQCPRCGKTLTISVKGGEYIFKCFHCGDVAGRRPIDYLMKGRNMTFPDALKYLADHLGIILDIAPVESPKRVSKKKSFCDRMMEESGLTYKDVKAKVFLTSEATTIFQTPTIYKGTLSDNGEIDKDGDDAIIQYFDLAGYPIMYQQTDKKGKNIGRPKEYIRIRYQFPDEHKDKNGRAVKYRSPYGASSHIYIPQKVRELYHQGEEIPRLFIQEGEKKAEKACKHGILSLAIAGIQNLGQNGKLPEDIAKIIERCKVKEVVFLVDSDCFDLTSHIKINEPVEKRPRNFFYAVRNFKEYFNILKNRDIYIDIFFGYVLKNDAQDKGVDDLLTNTLKGREDELINDINTAINLKNMEGKYVKLHKITTISDGKLLEIWSLQSAASFCERYYEQLKDLPEFMFGKHRWRFNSDGKLETAQPLEQEEMFYEEKLINTKDGGTRRDYDFKYSRAFNFLQNRGFGRYLTKSGGYEFIFMNKPFVRTVTHYDIRDYITDFAKTYANEDVLDMLYRGGPQYLGPDKLSNLEYITPYFLKPARDMQCLYFAESVWEITSSDIKVKRYEDLNYQLWEEQKSIYRPTILPKLFEAYRDIDGKYQFHTTDIGKKSHFLQFIINTSNFTWRKEKMIKECNEDVRIEPIELEENIQHIISKLCAIGYLSMTSKDRSVAKAVIGMDGKQSDIGTSNGRSGKSLVGELLRYVVVTKYIGGKSFDIEKSSFPWEGISEKTKLVFIDDVKRDFNFEMLFPNITGNWQINAKNEKQYDIDFEESPKLYITSNHAMRGDGGSFKDRQWQLAFSDYYNDEHKPVDDFGVMFFSDWEFDQWNLTWNLVSQCIQLYLTLGCVESPSERLEKRKYRAEAGEDFITWADEYYSDQHHINVRIARRELYDSLLSHIPKHLEKFYTPNSFRKKLMAYCKLNDLYFQPNKLDPDTKVPNAFNKDGEPKLEDKSNGVEYITVGDENYFTQSTEGIMQKLFSQYEDEDIDNDFNELG